MEYLENRKYVTTATVACIVSFCWISSSQLIGHVGLMFVIPKFYLTSAICAKLQLIYQLQLQLLMWADSSCGPVTTNTNKYEWDTIISIHRPHSPRSRTACSFQQICKNIVTLFVDKDLSNLSFKSYLRHFLPTLASFLEIYLSNI